MHNTAKYGVKNRKLLDGDHACKLIWNEYLNKKWWVEPEILTPRQILIF
jgi:hypothetical protein